MLTSAPQPYHSPTGHRKAYTVALTAPYTAKPITMLDKDGSQPNLGHR